MSKIDNLTVGVSLDDLDVTSLKGLIDVDSRHGQIVGNPKTSELNKVCEDDSLYRTMYFYDGEGFIPIKINRNHIKKIIEQLEIHI